MGVGLLFSAPALAADPWTPLRVMVDCEGGGRVDACTLGRGLLGQNKVFLVVPREEAEVVLYVHVTDRAATDLVYLRAVGRVPGAPEAFEQLQEVDTRAGVDAQQAQLAPGLWRVLTPYVSVRVPGAVSVTLAPPEGAVQAEAPSRAWGATAWLGGWGSYAPTYQELTVWGGVSAQVLEERRRADVWVSYDRSIERQPSLDVDGAEISLSSDAWYFVGAGSGAYNLNDHWSVGGVLRGGFEDPEGQYRATGRVHVGLEYNLFPSDDPRGNALAVAWLVGVQADAYHRTNVLGEDRALFPTHGLTAHAGVRKDKTSLYLDAGVGAELLRPDRRYVLTASGGTDLTLGDHIDLGFGGGAFLRAIPGPAEIDTSSYEEVTRASYAEPFEAWMNVNVRLHWDPTNGARNNRFEIARNLDPTGSL